MYEAAKRAMRDPEGRAHIPKQEVLDYGDVEWWQNPTGPFPWSTDEDKAIILGTATNTLEGFWAHLGDPADLFRSEREFSKYLAGARRVRGAYYHHMRSYKGLPRRRLVVEPHLTPMIALDIICQHLGVPPIDPEEARAAVEERRSYYVSLSQAVQGQANEPAPPQRRAARFAGGGGGDSQSLRLGSVPGEVLSQRTPMQSQSVVSMFSQSLVESQTPALAEDPETAARAPPLPGRWSAKDSPMLEVVKQLLSQAGLVVTEAVGRTQVSSLLGGRPLEPGERLLIIIPHGSPEMVVMFGIADSAKSSTVHTQVFGATAWPFRCFFKGTLTSGLAGNDVTLCTVTRARTGTNAAAPPPDTTGVSESGTQEGTAHNLHTSEQKGKGPLRRLWSRCDGPLFSASPDPDPFATLPRLDMASWRRAWRRMLWVKRMLGVPAQRQHRFRRLQRSYAGEGLDNEAERGRDNLTDEECEEEEPEEENGNVPPVDDYEAVAKGKAFDASDSFHISPLSENSHTVLLGAKRTRDSASDDDE